MRAFVIPVLLGLALVFPRQAATVPPSLAQVRHSRFLPIIQRQYLPPEPCLPRYGAREFLFSLNDDLDEREAFPTAADFNGDGLADIVVTRLQFLTDATYGLDILLNDGMGGMVLATSALFSGSVPMVQHPSEVITEDLNGDGRADIFVANSGRDSNPFPGFQNALALTSPGGGMVDATGNLPQQDDFSHSAAAADIDGDGDIDLYVGNIWGQNRINPQILVNDGQGRFTVGEERLPPLLHLDHNGYRICTFTDVNNDGSADLVLGDVGAEQTNTHSTPTSEVLLNNGAGVFARLPGAMPPMTYSPTDSAHDITPLDLNGDGFVDLMAVYERQSDLACYIQALINNQDGTFRDDSATRLDSFYRHVWPNWRATSGNPRRTLDLRDMDRDGDLDLLAKPWDADDPEPLLFLNHDGRFVYHPLELDLEGGSLYYTFIELEDDGGHDLLLTLNFPPDNVFVIRDLGCQVP
jgi:hypothetical protein